jgi:hypothetical protein
MGVDWIYLAHDCCEHSSGSIKFVEFLGYLSNY